MTKIRQHIEPLPVRIDELVEKSDAGLKLLGSNDLLCGEERSQQRIDQYKQVATEYLCKPVRIHGRV